jgi:hypothetical protein
MLLCGAALAAHSTAEVARAQPVDACVGAPDGTPCEENGDGCFYNSRKDACAAGVCKSPPACDRTTFTALPGGRLRMDWSKDPAQVVTGEFCQGDGFVTPEQVRAVLGITPPADGGLVPITRARQSRKNVPPSGKVRVTLRLNNLGRLLLARASASGSGVEALARMTLTQPGAPPRGANRLIALRRR